MERLTAIASLAQALVALSAQGDTIQLRPEDGVMTMLNRIDNVDQDKVVDAYDTFTEKLVVRGVTPSAWLINDERPIGEALYSYPDLKLVLSYNVDGQTIALTSDTSIHLNIESETVRLKAGTYEESYLELLFNENAPLVLDILEGHGLKIKKLDTASKYVTKIELEPRT